MAICSGQPGTTPLWLNRYRPAANGAAAPTVYGRPGVPDRTAASSARVRTTRARSVNEESVHIGWSLR
jgi:hypothetical protein